MADLEIIGVPQSNFVRTVRMALEEKGIVYKLTPARPHSPEVDAIHPFGKVPVMRHGDFTLCESRAIIAYADRAFDGPKLVPDDAKRAATIEQWASLFANGVFPLFFPYLRENYFPQGGTSSRAAIEAQLPSVRQAIGVLDRAAANGSIGGAEFSIADMYALPMIAFMRALPESRDMLADSPSVTAYYDRHADRPSFRTTAAPPLGG